MNVFCRDVVEFFKVLGDALLSNKHVVRFDYPPDRIGFVIDNVDRYLMRKKQFEYAKSIQMIDADSYLGLPEE